MTPVSGRYAMPAAALLLAAGALILGISRDRTVHETCLHPERLPEITRGEHYLPRGRVQAKESDTLIAYAEGEIPAVRGERAGVRFWSIRSIRPAEIYERPIRFIPGKLAPELTGLVRRETAHGELPIRVLEDYTIQPSGIVIAYVLVYGNDPTANAFRTHLAHLWSSMTKGATPLTLLMVQTPADRRTADVARERAIAAVSGAYDLFAAACRP